MASEDLRLSGQCADPEIVRDNFNQIRRLINGANSNVIRLQSEDTDFTSLGVNSTIRTFTVFIQSDGASSTITIPNPRIFADAEINKNNTIWIFKGVSGAFAKSVIPAFGTIDGASSINIANDQTIFIQSNGEEYKTLIDSSAAAGSETLQQAYDAAPTQPQILDVSGDGIQFLSLLTIDYIVTDGSFVSEAEIVPTQVNLTSASTTPGTNCNINLNGNSGSIDFGASAGKFRFNEVPEFADNAAAISGGLNPTEIYRTDDNLKIVH